MRALAAGINSIPSVLARLRAWAAPVWRKSVRVSTVAVGIAVFAALQYALAYSCIQLWWFYVVAFFVVVIALVLAAKWPIAAFVVWLFLSPVGFVFLRLDFGEGLPAVSFDRVVMSALCGFFVIRTLALRRPIKQFNLAEKIMLAFIIYVFAVLFATGRYGGSLSNILADRSDFFVLAFIIYFVAKACIEKREHIAWILVTLSLVGLYCALFGIYEHYTGNRWYSSFTGVESQLGYQGIEKGRSTGPLLNPSPYGTLLSITIFLTIHLAFATNRLWAKIFYVASIVLQIIGLYYCYTRGGYLPAVVIMLLMPFLTFRYSKRWVASGVALVVITMAAIPILMSNEAFSRRMTNTLNVYTRLVGGATLINMINKNFWFGVGMGNADALMEEYLVNAGTISGLYGRGYSPNQPNLARTFSSHNSMLSLIAETGVIGGVLYFGAFMLFGIQAYRTMRIMPRSGFLSKDYAALFIAGALGHLASISTYDVKYFRYLPYVIMLSFALVIRYYELYKDGLIQDEEESAVSIAAA